jgi:hypothetical protein
VLTLLEPGLPQSWLPDETLFSLCSRYHAASGNRLPSTTCQMLFGHKMQGSAHDFPARLGHFVAVSDGRLGNIHDIVEERSVLPLYMRFTTANLVENVLEAAGKSSAGSLKFQLGLLTSRFRANHPLKGCPVCMTENMRDHSTSFWHREHQMPGVWVCRLHGCRLLASDLKATGVSRFHWLLPTRSQFPVHDDSPPSVSAIRLAEMVIDLVSMRSLRLSPQVLCLTYRAVLRDRGLLAGSNQRLRHGDAGRSYAAFVAPLLSLQQLDGLPASVDGAAGEIARLVGPVRSGIHPLRHLALSAWLFRDSKELLEQYEAVGSLACAALGPEDTIRDVHAVGNEDRRSQFFAHISAGASVTGAARHAGIDPTTGMAWAAAQGISTPRRAKHLKADIRMALIALLRSGASKAQAAESAKVSQTTITTVLRTEVGLHDAWKQAQFTNTQCSMRTKWECVITTNPLSGVKAARMSEPAIYAWLYRNDRDWLTAQTVAMVKAARNPQARVDWDKRDRNLADQVRRVALRLFEAKPDGRIKLFELYQQLPELKAKLFKLDRLPLTRAAIFDVLRRASGQYELREGNLG